MTFLLKDTSSATSSIKILEDPVEDFIRLRDYIDCMECRSLPAFTPENVRRGFSQDMITEAKKHRKINKEMTSKQGYTKTLYTDSTVKYKESLEIERILSTQNQSRRVYEILKLGATNLNDPQQHREYRIEIKKRLNAPFQKQKADLQKLQKVLTPEEYVTAVANMSTKEHLEVLDENYQTTVATYRRTLERIAAS